MENKILIMYNLRIKEIEVIFFYWKIRILGKIKGK